jgi:hypothetical protein
MKKLISLLFISFDGSGSDPPGAGRKVSIQAASRMFIWKVCGR